MVEGHPNDRTESPSEQKICLNCAYFIAGKAANQFKCIKKRGALVRPEESCEAFQRNLSGEANREIKMSKESSGATQTEANEGSKPAVDPKLVGLGGWLTLPAIGFAVGPPIGIVSVIISFIIFLDVWPKAKGVYLLECIVYLVLVAFLIYTSSRFFRKKRNAPSIVIALWCVDLFACFALYAIWSLLKANLDAMPFDIPTGQALRIAEEHIEYAQWALWHGGINAAIWIPYFISSKRVKATFVN